MNIKLYFLILILIILDISGLAAAKQFQISHNKFFLAAGMICFAFIPLVFSFATKYASSGVANAIWAGISTILITASGYLIFKEIVSTWQIIGILTIAVGLFLMEIK